MAKSKSLKVAVNKEVKEAVQDAKTGDVVTSKSPAASVDLPTGNRSHPPS